MKAVDGMRKAHLALYRQREVSAELGLRSSRVRALSKNVFEVVYFGVLSLEAALRFKEIFGAPRVDFELGGGDTIIRLNLGRLGTAEDNLKEAA